jgi:Protein of unknown function (DUF2628)
MSVYTVHEPSLGKTETAANPVRFVFVRDGFSFWALLFGPVWMLWHRMWLVLLGYVVLMTALFFALRAAGVSENMTLLVHGLVALLIGFEAATLRRFTLARRRFRQVGLVVGDNIEAAEQRFFDAWVPQQRTPGKPDLPVQSVQPAQPYTLAAPVGPLTARRDVIGLFPEQGGRV